jgi:hypothetical protein
MASWVEGGTKGLLDRIFHGLGTVFRRRGRAMLVGCGATLAAGVLVLGSMPTVYSARALVGPAVGTYDGPIDRLTEQTLSPAVLAEVASACRLSPHRGVGEALARVPGDPVERLDARLEVRGAPVQGVVVEASGTSRLLAELAADLLAARLVAADAEHRARARGAAPVATSSATDASAEVATAIPSRLLLEQLRLRHPLLRDADADRRAQAIAARLSEDRIATAGLRGQLEGLGAEAERLEALVQEEATRAWRLDRAERLAQAERSAPTVAEGPPRGAPAPTSRVAELEAELQRLLATRTTLHPDVRRLMRMLDSERRSAAAAPVDDESRPVRAEPRSEQAGADVDRDLDRGVLAVADGPPDLAPPQAQPGPEVWTQRAPSYPAWVEARARVEETRLALDAREQERAAREREHDLLTKRLAELAGPRLEEARLVALVEAEARRADEVASAGPAQRPAQASPPLVVIHGAGVHAARSPWQHLPLWALASLLLPLFGGLLLEVRDRSVRGVEDLEGLGAPVLGVVPHLRWGR